MIARATPQLRIARFFVEGFRTFREREEIPLVNKAGVADEIAVFHGPNGSGKSNALAALETFFQVVDYWLEALQRNQPTEGGIVLDRDTGPITTTVLSHRNWPPVSIQPMRIELTFADAALGQLRAEITPSGRRLAVRVEKWSEGAWHPLEREIADALQTSLRRPLGPGSLPLAHLNARRQRYRNLSDFGEVEPMTGALSPRIATELYDLWSAMDPGDTERWRAFAAMLGRFATLSQHEISILQMAGRATELRFEIRGKQVLRLSELSSGEQQIVGLCAAVLTSRAAIVAIEEPEISLHPDYQGLLREVLAEQVENGIVDQVILESHSPKFDGPEVVQFSRTAAELPSTRVTRTPSAEGNPVLREQAKAAGAEERWVTRDGYTQLPPRMREQLGLAQTGGSVWFLPEAGGPAWKAWKEEELDAVFGDRTGGPEE